MGSARVCQFVCVPPATFCFLPVNRTPAAICMQCRAKWERANQDANFADPKSSHPDVCVFQRDSGLPGVSAQCVSRVQVVWDVCVVAPLSQRCFGVAARKRDVRKVV